MNPLPRLVHLLGASLLSTAAVLLTIAGAASAQLAEGPWSMFHHDVCHTGQSPHPGPLFPGTPGATDVKIWHGFDKLRTSPSLSADGTTIYFGMGFDFCSVDAASMATNDCLLLPADVSDSSPAVAANGTIYMGDRDNSLNAYKSDPATKKITLKWRYNHGHEGDIWQSPAIAPSSLPAAGTIYFTHDQSTDGAGIFTALVDNGTSAPGNTSCETTGACTVKWKYKIGNFVRQSSPVIDQNGIIYFGDLNGYVYAFRDKGACPANDLMCKNVTPPNQVGPVLLWKKQVSAAPGITASPVISADSNTLYIGTSGAVSGIPVGLTALDISTPCSGPPCPLPAVKWTFATIGKVDQTPALGRDGTLYVPAMYSGQKRLYAVTPAGALKWVFGPINTGSETSAYPIVAGDDTVYVGLGTTIYALDPDTGTPTTPPTQLWKYATTNYIQSSPLIGPVSGGRAILYVPSRDHNLYAISSPRSDTITPTTCWAEGTPTGNQPPVANAGPDQSVVVGNSVTFDGSGSFDPDDAFNTLTFTWAFGDGSGLAPCAASSSACVHPTHTYTQTGSYTATLTVSDGELTSLPDSVNITVGSSSGGGCAGSFCDTFTRADSSDLGPQWTELAGDLMISNNQLQNAVRGDNIAVVNNLSGATQSVSADFASLNNNSGPRLGVLLRATDARNHYRLYRSIGGSNELRISRVVNGAETILKRVTVALPVQGTLFHLVASVTGTTLTLTMGSTSISVTDATYASGSVAVFNNPGGVQGPHVADNFCASIGGTCP